MQTIRPFPLDRLLYLAPPTAILLCLIGCSPQQEGVNASTPQEALRWDRVSRLKGNTASADLQGVADNSSLTREKRAEAIFSLFVNQLKLPQGAAEVGEALKGEKWL